MVAVGIHASHEQIAPSALLTAMREAEAAGFARAWSSDHFSPWSERQGESGFAWSWLGAAMQATSMPYGVVNAPGQRYHPAIVAQAAATLAELFPGRLSVALGTGEFSNEHITGAPWPRKATRNARLRECVDVMRALFRGRGRDHDGLVTVDRAQLWTLPAEPPACSRPRSAPRRPAGRRVGGRADHHQPAAAKLSRVIDAFREQAGTASPLRSRRTCRGPPTDDEALASPTTSGAPTCSRRRCAGTSRRSSSSTRPPARAPRGRACSGAGLVRSAQHVAWIQELAELGLDALYVHHVGQEQRRFIHAFGEHVLPRL